MKKLYYIVGLICLCASFLSAQKYDRYWIGQDWWNSDGKGTMVLMRFDEEGVSYELFDPPEGSIIFTSTGMIAISDARGEFQFYTNGNVVVSWDKYIMEGGKGFNEGASYDDFNPIMGIQ